MRRSRTAVLAAVLLGGLLATTSPASAQFYFVEAGRGGYAFFEETAGDGSTVYSVAFGVGYEGVAGAPLPDSYGGVFFCAEVGSYDGTVVDFGCGEGAVDVDLLLETGTFSAELDSEVFDWATGESLPSTISVSVTLSGDGPLLPGAFAGAGAGVFPPSVFADAFVYSELFREAAPDGVVTSATLAGPGAGATGFAGMFEGAVGFAFV